MAEQEINSIWVPDFVSFQNEQDRPVLKSECIVCGALLDISHKVKEILVSELDSENPAASLAEFFEKHNLERTCILKCGHSLGESCFKQHSVAQRRRHGVSHNCPVCREALACRNCGRSTKPVTVPCIQQWPLGTASFDPSKAFRDHVPLTAAERDLRMNGSACKPCLRLQIMKNALETATALRSKCPLDDDEGAQGTCQVDHKEYRETNLVERYQESVNDIAQQIYAVVDLHREPQKAEEWKQERRRMHDDFVHSLVDGNMKDFQNTVWAVCNQDSQSLQLAPLYERRQSLFKEFLSEAANTSIEHMGSRWSELEDDIETLEQDASPVSDDDTFGFGDGPFGFDNALRDMVDNFWRSRLPDEDDEEQGFNVDNDEQLENLTPGRDISPLNNPPAEDVLGDIMRTLMRATATLILADSQQSMPSMLASQHGGSFSWSVIRQNHMLAFTSGIERVLDNPEELESLIQRAMEAVAADRDSDSGPNEDSEAHEEPVDN